MTLCLSGLSAKTQYPGLATVTSLSGEAELVTAEGRERSIELHQTTPLTQSDLRTGDGSKIIFALSNHLALGLAPNSEIRIGNFEQSEFSNDVASMEREPSTSNLDIELKQGNLVLSTDQLSPLSRVRVILPIGELHLLASESIISVEGGTIYVTVLDGAVTFAHESSAQRQYLTAPTRVRISAETVQLTRLPAVDPENTRSEALAQLSQSVRQATKRVFFTGDNLSAGTKPKLVVSPEYFNAPVARPYEYVEEE